MGVLSSARSDGSSLENNIVELLYTTEALIGWCEYLWRKHRMVWESGSSNLRVDDEKIIFLVIQINMLFSEALLRLNTVVMGRTDEMSFKNLGKVKKSSQFNRFLNSIQSEYESAGLKLLRDDIFAHKNHKRSGDPAAAYLNVIRFQHIKNTIDIAEKSLNYARDNFPDIVGNNYVKDFYEDGFNYLNILIEE
jgi:hypothetical protein